MVKLNTEFVAFPTHLQQSLRDYVDRGIPQGGFLYHVLCNDLGGAVACDTDEELLFIRALLQWIQNCVPEAAWGTEAKYLRWVQEHPGQARGPKDLD